VLEWIKVCVGEWLVYLLVDIDVFDFVFAFGIGMLEVGGMMSCELFVVLCGFVDFNFVGVYFYFW